MNQPLRSELGGSVLIGLAIIASSWVAAHAAANGWPIMAAPLLLAAAFAAAELYVARIERRAPRWLIIASTAVTTILLPAALLSTRGAAGVADMLPVLGAVGWVGLGFVGRRCAKNGFDETNANITSG